MSYPVQIESSFISPLKRYHTDIETQFGENEIRKILIQKHLIRNWGIHVFLWISLKWFFKAPLIKRNRTTINKFPQR